MYHDDDLLNQVEMERQSIDKQLHKEYLNRASAFLDGSRKFRTWAKEYQWEACEKFQVTYHLLLEFTYPFIKIFTFDFHVYFHINFAICTQLHSVFCF